MHVECESLLHAICQNHDEPNIKLLPNTNKSTKVTNKLKFESKPNNPKGVPIKPNHILDHKGRFHLLM